jgi:DnaJ-like protein
MRTFDRLPQTDGATRPNGAGTSVRSCDWIGCEQVGLHKAPRSRSDLHQYVWFCLDHVRQYNAAWNYYRGMSDDEVEADLRFDVVWQRPSWPLSAAIRVRNWRTNSIHDGFGTFSEAPPPPRPVAATAEERALAILDLRPPVTVAIVKTRYKKLVKQHHPDANGGDKAAEERFKQISDAYRTVMNSLVP